MAHFFYLDESGDPGLNASASSSRHYALALVQLSERASLPELVAVRRALYLSPMFEFKYHKTTQAQKEVFFRAIQPLTFGVRAVVVDKFRLDMSYKDMSGQELAIEFVSRLALRASEQDIANDVLIVDGATPVMRRALRHSISEACHRLERVRPFKKIVGADSARDDGLQMADMIAGALRHFAMGTEINFYQMFASKVIDLWIVPAEGK